MQWNATASEFVMRKAFEPSHGIMVLSILRKLIFQMSMRSHPMGLDVWFFGQTLRLLPYFMCANSEGSGKTVRMHRLARAFAGRLCDKYHNLIGWLVWVPLLLEPYYWLIWPWLCMQMCTISKVEITKKNTMDGIQGWKRKHLFC